MLSMGRWASRRGRTPADLAFAATAPGSRRGSCPALAGPPPERLTGPTALSERVSCRTRLGMSRRRAGRGDRPVQIGRVGTLVLLQRSEQHECRSSVERYRCPSGGIKRACRVDWRESRRPAHPAAGRRRRGATCIEELPESRRPHAGLHGHYSNTGYIFVWPLTSTV